GQRNDPPDPPIVLLTESRLRALVGEAVADALGEREGDSPRTELVSGSELAVLLGVSRTSVHRLRVRGMPAVPILDTYRFRPAECLAWLQSGQGSEPEDGAQ